MSDELFFYAQDGDELADLQSLDEAVQEYIEGYGYDEPLPNTITVCKFSVAEIPRWSFAVLAILLDRLDDEFSDPDGEPTEPTQAMKDAEEAFITVMQKEYENHYLSLVEKIEVDLKKWCAENGYEAEWHTCRGVGI